MTTPSDLLGQTSIAFETLQSQGILEDNIGMDEFSRLEESFALDD